MHSSYCRGHIQSSFIAIILKAEHPKIRASDFAGPCRDLASFLLKMEALAADVGMTLAVTNMMLL